MKILISSLEKFYSYLPSLSPSLKEFIVKILPLFAIFFGVLVTLASVLDFLGSAFISSLALGGGPSIVQQLLLRSVLGIVQGILMIFAFTPLKHKHQSGWKLLFLSQVIWIIAAVVSLNPTVILGFIILYPLFQVKSYFN